jgi:predicted nucleic acid-binding protein
VVYLDANVFAFATLATDELGNNARYILANLYRTKARTCCLTIDELAWAILRRADAKRAVEACRAVLSLKGLEVVSVEYADVWQATIEMEKWGLKPRDAIHLAVMRRLGEREIVTEDPHFERAGVKRIPIPDFAGSLK